MSGTDDSAVVGCVAAIVSAYQDATELLRDIEDRRRAKSARRAGKVDERASQDLLLSVARGQEVIRSQYERDFKRLGSPFATGDHIARDTLKDIVVRMQKQVVSQLKLAWHNDTPVDYFALQDVSDDSQDRAIMVLMQLHQRLLVAAPIDVISTAAPTSRPRAGTAGKPQGFVEEAGGSHFDGRPPTHQIYGNYVEISGGSDPNIEKKSKTRFIPGFSKKGPEEKERRIPASLHSNARHFAPQEQRYNRYYDNRRAEHFYDPHQQEMQIEPSEQDSYEDQNFSHSPETPRALHHPHHEPLRAPTSRGRSTRHSAVSSISSFGSGEHERPDYNPWAATDGVSPLSSIADEIASGSPYNNNPLVPEALEPRRNRESQITVHSRTTSRTLYNSLESASNTSVEGYNEDFPEKFHKLRMTDADSVYSQKSSSSSIQPSYYTSPSPSDHTRQRNIVASQNERPIDLWGRDDLANTRSPPHLPQLQMPQHHLSRIAERKASPLHNESPVRPSPPLEHERPFTHSPISSPIYPYPSPPPENGYGPPPTAPPDRPIPRPAPRIPERAPNRPRGASNVSRSNSNNSPITPQTPATPSVNSNTPTASSSRSINLKSELELGPPGPPPPALSSTSSPTSLMASDMMFAGITAATAPRPRKRPSNGLKRANSVMSTSTTMSNSHALAAPPIKIIAPLTTGNIKAYLPAEANKYAGFCKGAWRAQIGDTKKTWEERSRPQGMYTSMNQYLKCQKCSFEGPSIRKPGEKKGSVDTKIYGRDRILYRWEFLFKSHIPEKKSGVGPMECAYGCMFCCAEGKGTLIFQGVGALLAHLQEHRANIPKGEIIYRMHAVVGRDPEPNEDWQIVIPAKTSPDPSIR